MLLKIDEILDGKTGEFAGLEIKIGTKKFFISSNQKVLSGVRVGEFPHPGYGKPYWRKNRIYSKQLKDV